MIVKQCIVVVGGLELKVMIIATLDSGVDDTRLLIDLADQCYLFDSISRFALVRSKFAQTVASANLFFFIAIQ